MKVLVLGGYGNFGRLVAKALRGAEGIEVVVAGRDPAKADVRIDANDPGLAARFTEAGASVVVSTAGPFQGQDYRVARAAIAAGAHYVDIADAREFVCGIGALDAEARERGVLVVSGASSVPALTAAIVDRYAPEFATLEDIDIGICTSSRIPGIATVEAILGYCGRPIPHGAFGWQGLRRHRFRQADFARWICDCDVPDLELFPSRYRGLTRIRFGAGLQPTFVHFGLWMLSGAVRAGVIRSLAPAAGLLAAIARRLEPLGSARSALFVRLSGRAPNGTARSRTWELVAERHEGANIPGMGAVALVRKLAWGAIDVRGAMPCVGLLTLDEYLGELGGFPVSWGAFDD